jgi:hypothetical protein
MLVWYRDNKSTKLMTRSKWVRLTSRGDLAGSTEIYPTSGRVPRRHLSLNDRLLTIHIIDIQNAVM